MSNNLKVKTELVLTAKTGPMLLELLTKAAATGPDAATLGQLYGQVKAMCDYHWPPQVKAPSGP